MSVLVGACLALSLCSCETVPGSPTMDPARAKRLAKGAVSIIVVSVIENNPSHAQQVINDAELLKGVIGTDGFNTVDLIMGVVQAKIAASGMKPGAQIAVALALGEITDYLHGVIGTGTIPTDKLPLVTEVIGWVEDAAKMATPPVVAPPPAPVSP